MTTPTFFRTPAAFRQWLAQHAAHAPELLVGFYKTGSGRPSMTWPESVDEALCVGWIDGVRRRVDDAAYCIRFTPRKPSSIWSAVNIAKYAALEAQGRITPPGAAAFARRSEARSRVYAYEQAEVAALTAAEERVFAGDAAAWAWWAAASPAYRKLALHHIAGARRPETRAARLARLIAACSAGRRL